MEEAIERNKVRTLLCGLKFRMNGCLSESLAEIRSFGFCVSNFIDIKYGQLKFFGPRVIEIELKVNYQIEMTFIKVKLLI